MKADTCIRSDGIDYRNLRTVEQIVARAAALTPGGMRYWIFFAERNRLSKVLVKIDSNVYLDVPAFNAWLSEGKPYICDYKNLRTVQQILAKSTLKESKLRHWLKHAKENGLEIAIIRKNPRKLLIDTPMFNTWLAIQNVNDKYGE